MKDFAEVEEKIIVGLLITATVLVVQGYGNRCEKKDAIELYDKQNPTYYKCWPFPECLDGQEPTVEPGSTHPMGTDISCQSCQQNFYSNKGTNIRCRKCTSCGKKLELSPCLSVKDRECADRCISNDYYFNSTDKECHRCTECCEDDNMNIESQCIKLTPGTVIGGKGQKHCRRSPKPCNDLPKKNLTSSGCDCNNTMLSDSSLLKGSNTQMNCSSPNKTSLIEKEQTNQNLSSSSKHCSGHSFDRLHITLLCLLGLSISVILFWGWLAWKRRKQSLHSENSFPLESLGCSSVRSVICLPTCSSLAEREPLRTGSNSHQEELNVIPEGNNISRNEGSSHASDAQWEDYLNVENIPADILVSSMENLCDENGTLFHYVQMKLDAFETNTCKTWFSVGRELKVKSDMLNLMKAERRSHTECLLEHLKTLAKEPTMREFVQALKNCGRNDIAKYICNWPWPQQNIE